MQATHLKHKDAHTLQLIFQHPVAHNLEWHDVIALITHLGTVEENDNGHLTYTINGTSQVFHRSRDKNVSDIEQVLDLRHFLENAGFNRSGMIATETMESDLKLRFLVVINQQESLVFRSEEHDSVPKRLHPHDPHGEMQRLKHQKGEDAGSQATENLIYYKEIAEALHDAEEILLMGNGTGASSTMTHFQHFLEAHHPEVEQRIVGTLTKDIEALTEGQLLQEARTFFEMNS